MRISIDGDDYDPSFFKKIADKIPSYDFNDLSLDKIKFAQSDILRFDIDLDPQNKKITIYLSSTNIPSSDDFKKIVHFINCIVNTLLHIYPQVKTIMELHNEQMSKLLKKFDNRIIGEIDTTRIESFIKATLLALSKWFAVKRLDNASHEHLKSYILQGVDLEAISKIKCSEALLVNESWRYRSYDEPIPNQILKAGGKSGTIILQMMDMWVKTIPNPSTKNLVDAATYTTECVKTMFFGCYGNASSA